MDNLTLRTLNGTIELSDQTAIVLGGRGKRIITVPPQHPGAEADRLDSAFKRPM